jgi:two-component system sensor histidine kinase BaeS
VLILAVLGAATVASWILGSAPPWARSPLAFAPLLLLVLLFAAGIVLRARSRLWRPLGGIVEAADRVAEGDFSRKVTEEGPPFLRSVARAFNGMTARLARQDEQRRHLMADIAHELRTPLAIVQGRLEGLIDGVYSLDRAYLAETLDEVKVIARLVEDLRILAETESGMLTLRREPADLTLLASEVLAALKSDADVRGVQLVEVAGVPVMANVDPLRIRQVLVNLVSNAVRHGPAGTHVRVSVEAAGDAVVVTVADTGTGIPPHELPYIFDRFSKGSGSGGTGLGLTIARNLVVAHGGEIAVGGEVGKGTVITVRLPTGRVGSDEAHRNVRG